MDVASHVTKAVLFLSILYDSSPFFQRLTKEIIESLGTRNQEQRASWVSLLTYVIPGLTCIKHT